MAKVVCGQYAQELREDEIKQSGAGSEYEVTYSEFRRILDEQIRGKFYFLITKVNGCVLACAADTRKPEAIRYGMFDDADAMTIWFGGDERTNLLHSARKI